MKRRHLILAWLALQAAVVATVAYLAANLVHGEDQPFFAPVAAVVAMTAPRGERGAKAVQLLLGVFLGIVVGEIIVVAMGAGYGRLAIATFVALSIAMTIGNARVGVTQAGVSAILTVIAAQGEAGWQRLVDAAIGGGVALLFTQVIFSPEPVALLREAETDALRELARSLAVMADALRATDKTVADRALEMVRALRARLGELARLRHAGSRVARRSALWQSQRAAVAREKAQADQLDLIAGASVMLARTSFEVTSPRREALAGRIGELGVVLEHLADAPGDQEVRQRAVENTLAASRPLAADDAADAEDPDAVTAFAVLRIVARDILVFAGLTPAEATEAMHGGETGAEVPRPPPTPRLPFGLDRRRGERRSSGKLPRRETDRPDSRAK